MAACLAGSIISESLWVYLHNHKSKRCDIGLLVKYVLALGRTDIVLFNVTFTVAALFAVVCLKNRIYILNKYHLIERRKQSFCLFLF